MISGGESKNEGRVILVDKPKGWSSFRAVKKIRYHLKEKVGHAGTLDPLATGLLIMCSGKMTKRISEYQDMEKEYFAVMEIGKTTPSIDLETDFDAEYDITGITEEAIYALRKEFTGLITQTPPIYSAIKVGGERLYHKARKGEKAEIKSRQVTISEFEILNIDLPRITFKMVCSKGAYVRSLVRDFGEKLGVGAHLVELRRVRIGDYHVDQALQMDEASLKTELANESLSRRP